MPDDQLIGHVIAERYHILELLGVGGMGRVYLAEHVALGRKCAVKMISPAFATSVDAITRFNREAANASRINHPNVAQIYDFGATNTGTLYLAMELVEGEVLAAILQRLGALPITRAAAITAQIADALAAAHHLSIVHRDLKPENIMIGHRHDGADWVKVVDFGIAKTVEHEGGSQTVTTAGISVGTPAYMSPEQLAGVRVDHRSDIYALGLVCFHMLTGELPHPQVTSKESLVHRLTARPKQLAEARPDITWPAGLQAALDRALAPEADDRYARAVDFASDVSRAAERTAARLATPVSVGTVVPRPAAPHRAVRPTASPARGAHRRSRFWPALALALVVGLAAAAARNWQEVERIARLAGVPVPLDVLPVDTALTPTAAMPDVALIPQGTPGLVIAPATAAVLPADGATTARPHGAAPSAHAPHGVTDSAPPPRHGAPQPTPAPPQPGDSPPGDAPPAVPNVLRHPWLRANGDSGSALTVGANAPAEDRLSAMTDELQGHVQLGLRRIAQRDFTGARRSFRDAADEARILELTFPDPQVRRRVDALMLDAMRDAFHDCQAARADSANPDVASLDCGALFAR